MHPSLTHLQPSSLKEKHPIYTVISTLVLLITFFLFFFDLKSSKRKQTAN